MNKENKKITIGLFIDTYFPMIDGVVNVVDNYAKRLVNVANVIVFAPGLNEGYDDSKFNYKVVRCKSKKVLGLDYSLAITDKEFKRKVLEYNLDIIHIHSPATIGMYGIKYARKYNIPLVGTVHSQFKQDFKRAVKLNWLTNMLTHAITNVYSKCDYVWAVNKEVARLFHEEYGYSKMPMVMNNATDLVLLEDKDKATRMIDDLYGIDETYKVFLFVGRINLLKNVDFIVRSLKVFSDNNPDIKFKMLFVGSGQDEKILKDLIKELNMEDNIIMCGKVTDRYKLSCYYARADLFLFPSLYDASSLVQIEAASQKTPTLFLRNSVTAGTVTDKVNGYLANNDVNDYANTIREILKNTKEYNSVCKNAYNDLYINWDNAIKKVYNLYLEYIEKRK